MLGLALEGNRGTVGMDRGKRMTLAYITLNVAHMPISQKEFEQLVGHWWGIEDGRGGEHRRFQYWRRNCIQRASVATYVQPAQAAAQQYRGEPASERRRLGVAGRGNSVESQMPRGSQPMGLNSVNGGGPQPLQPPGLSNQGCESAALKVQVETLARYLQMLTQRLRGSDPNYSGAAPQGWGSGLKHQVYQQYPQHPEWTYGQASGSQAPWAKQRATPSGNPGSA